jgi:hypothetical protein
MLFIYIKLLIFLFSTLVNLRELKKFKEFIFTSNIVFITNYIFTEQRGKIFRKNLKNILFIIV